jgi:hypothetical protein
LCKEEHERERDSFRRRRHQAGYAGNIERGLGGEHESRGAALNTAPARASTPSSSLSSSTSSTLPATKQRPLPGPTVDVINSAESMAEVMARAQAHRAKTSRELDLAAAHKRQAEFLYSPVISGSGSAHSPSLPSGGDSVVKNNNLSAPDLTGSAVDQNAINCEVDANALAAKLFKAKLRKDTALVAQLTAQLAAVQANPPSATSDAQISRPPAPPSNSSSNNKLTVLLPLVDKSI